MNGLTQLVQGGFILGLIEVAKRLGLPSKYAPLLAVILGLGLSFLGLRPSLFELITSGIGAGLVSMGLYSGGKNVAEPILARLRE